MAVQASLGKNFIMNILLAASSLIFPLITYPASGWHRTRCLCRVCGVLFYDDGVSGNSHLRDPRLRRCPR